MSLSHNNDDDNHNDYYVNHNNDVVVGGVNVWKLLLSLQNFMMITTKFDNKCYKFQNVCLSTYTHSHTHNTITYIYIYADHVCMTESSTTKLCVKNLLWCVGV